MLGSDASGFTLFYQALDPFGRFRLGPNALLIVSAGSRRLRRSLRERPSAYRRAPKHSLPSFRSLLPMPKSTLPPRGSITRLPTRSNCRMSSATASFPIFWRSRRSASGCNATRPLTIGLRGRARPGRTTDCNDYRQKAPPAAKDPGLAQCRSPPRPS